MAPEMVSKMMLLRSTNDTNLFRKRAVEMRVGSQMVVSRYVDATSQIAKNATKRPMGQRLHMYMTKAPTKKCRGP